MAKHRYRSRTLVVAVTALVAIVAFGVIGGAALAHDGKKKPKTAGQTQYGSMGQYQYGKRVVICHKGKTIVVSGSAVRTHLKHRSSLGSCAVKSHKSKSRGKHKSESRGHGKSQGKGGKIGVVKRSDGSGIAAVTITKPVSNGDHDDDDDDDDDHHGKGKGRDRR